MNFQKLLCLFFLIPTSFLYSQTTTPNILFIMTDDHGVDAMNGYHEPSITLTTPTLDSLRATGITFENAFSTPKCSPSRSAIMSGKFGLKTGVTGTPGNLDVMETSIFKAIENETNNSYTDAVIGKWHLAHPNDPDHPIDHGADYYMGLLGSGVTDYFSWEKTENGMTTVETDYVTSTLTDGAINWINSQSQNQPWFLWLAHAAPHSPLHEPPSYMHTFNSTPNGYRKYLAMIESVDYEIGRLFAGIPTAVLQNTIIVFIGDNGTSGNVLKDYPTGHGKGSVYQGGIRVPFVVSGAGVTRQGERESALVHISDLYATFLEVAGADVGGVHHSLSMKHLFTNDVGEIRDYNYSEITEMGEESFAIRNAQYKLIEDANTGAQEFYDLLRDSLEFNDILAGGSPMTAGELLAKRDMEQEVALVRTDWSCSDYIQNGDETSIDVGSATCRNIFVDVTATGANDGTSWANAFTDWLCSLKLLASKSVWDKSIFVF